MTCAVECLVEITVDGYLRLDRESAERFFPNDTLVVLHKDGEWVLMPTRGPAGGGMVLKQRNLRGDRSLLLVEMVQWIPLNGFYLARWDEASGGLRFQSNGNGSHQESMSKE
ncbi:MAG: hypothetical protein U0905_13535 [Pirellulales bacterium]